MRHVLGDFRAVLEEDYMEMADFRFHESDKVENMVGREFYRSTCVFVWCIRPRFSVWCFSGVVIWSVWLCVMRCN